MKDPGAEQDENADYNVGNNAVAMELATVVAGKGKGQSKGRAPPLPPKLLTQAPKRPVIASPPLNLKVRGAQDALNVTPFTVVTRLNGTREIHRREGAETQVSLDVSELPTLDGAGMPIHVAVAAPIASAESETEEQLQEWCRENQRKLLASIETFEPEVPQPVYDGTGVGLVFDARMARHRNLDDPSHPEQPARIIRIFECLQEVNLVERCVRIPCRKARREELESQHTPAHVDAIFKVESLSEEEAVQEQKRYNSVYLSPESTQAALLSAGAVLEAVERVCSGDVERAVCVGRPPGHHAEPDRAMGFSLFGNVAVAVAEARRRSLSKRTLIVDWDVHHGNGTQRMFEEDDTVLFFSIHRYDSGVFYPGGEYASHTSHGIGAGSGYSVNVPWNVNKGLIKKHIGSPGDPEYLEAFAQVLLPIAKEFNPDLVVVSAGFDSALGDPLGECRVTPSGFHQLTEHLLDLANGRLVLALEGGYNLEAISTSMASCVRALLRDTLSVVDEPRPVLPFYAETIETVRAHFAQFWTSLRKEGEGPKAPEIRVPAAALKGSLAEMEEALLERAQESGVPIEELRRKQQEQLFKLEEVPEIIATSGRRELKQSFARSGPFVLPVIYVVSVEQAIRNAGVVFQSGAHGVWLMNAGHAHLPPESAILGSDPAPQKTGLKTATGPAGKAGRAQLNALAECISAVRERFQKEWIGVGLPQLPAAQVFKWMAANAPSADAVWIDELPCKPAEIIWQSSTDCTIAEQQQYAVRLDKWFSETQPALKAVKRERQSASWQGLVFGSIAGRCQQRIHHEQDAAQMGGACQALLQYWASLAGSVCDVLVSSSGRRGEACSGAKLRAMANVGQVSMLTCGAQPHEAEVACIGCLDALMVDTTLNENLQPLEFDASHIQPWLPARVLG